MWKKLLIVMAMLYAATAFAAVDVNKASAAELDGIKGIGPAISAKIVDERKKGNFKDWSDFIERVKGIGEGNAAKLSSEGMTVNGTGFKGVMAAKTDTKAPAAAAPAAKSDKVDAKAEAKMKADEAKKAKAELASKNAEESKAKKEAAKQAAADKKKAKADAPSAAASAAKK